MKFAINLMQKILLIFTYPNEAEIAINKLICLFNLIKKIGKKQEQKKHIYIKYNLISVIKINLIE